jgi:hypothetical protein
MHCIDIYLEDVFNLKLVCLAKLSEKYQNLIKSETVLQFGNLHHATTIFRKLVKTFFHFFEILLSDNLIELFI